MTSIKKAVCGAVAVLAMSTVAEAAAEPTLVLVHGAHFAADAWQPLQNALGDRVKSVAVDLPGRNDNILPASVSLEMSAGMLCKSLGAVEGEKVLVAHSQGGAMVNAALGLCPDESISKLVYVSAVAPLNDTKVFSLLSKEDDQNYFEGVVFDEAAELLKIADPDKFADNFAQDATAEQRRWLKTHAVNEPAPAGGSKMKLDSDRFQQLDKYYVFAERDRIISLPSQQRIAESLKLKATFRLDSGHLPMLTQTDALADILLQVVER